MENPLLHLEPPIPFDRIQAVHIEPAIASLLEDARERLARLAAPTAPPDFENTMKGLVDFLELDPAPSFADKVRDQARKQQKYQSKHAYSLEKFGLDEARIREDLKFVYEEYAF